MFGVTSSRILFFSYLPSQQGILSMPTLAHSVQPYYGSKRKVFLVSVMHSLFLVLSEQNRRSSEENAVQLMGAGREIFRLQLAFNSIESQSSSENCLPFLMPIASLLKLAEQFIMTQANLNEFPVLEAPVRYFFNSCGLDMPLCLNLIRLQSFLRNLLHSGSSSYLMPSDQFIFPSDPFQIRENDFLSNLLQDFSPSEVQFVRNGYSETRTFFLGEEGASTRDSLHSLSWSARIFFSYIKTLHLSGSESMRAFCLTLAHRYIDCLVGRLNVFSHPKLMFHFVWECYRFSGLMIENFSEEDSTVSVRADNLFHLDWMMPHSEWCLLARSPHGFSSISLCYMFIRSYEVSGRNLQKDWFDSRLSYIPERSFPFFQRIFKYWLNACRRPIWSFLNAGELIQDSSLCLYRAPCSLTDLASMRFLESERTGPDSLTLDALDSLLNGREVEVTEPIVKCYLTELMTFRRFSPSLFAMRYIEGKLQELVALMNASRFLQAKACFLSLLRGLSYCEESFTSLCHMQLTVKIFLSALNQLGSSRSNVETELSALTHYWKVILGCSAFNFDPSLDEIFWKQVIELSRYQFNPIRQARLNELYPVRTRRPDSDWLLQLFYSMNMAD